MPSDVAPEPRLNFTEFDKHAFVSVDDLHAWLERSVVLLEGSKRMSKAEQKTAIQTVKLIQRTLLQAFVEARGGIGAEDPRQP